MTWSELTYLGLPWITIIAIIVGPIMAVIVTRKMDEERESRQRKLDVFRSLMKTRQIKLDPVHVDALNHIELEFYGKTSVTTPYRGYIKHLYSAMPTPEQQARFFDEREDLFVDLLQALGKELGYTFDKHELKRLGYAPLGWEQDQNIQRKNATLISEVLEGKRPLPIAPMQITPNSPFPPPPKIDNLTNDNSA